MSSNDVLLYKYVAISNAADATIPTAYCLGGILCSSSTSGTVKIYDNSAASGAVLVDTLTLTAGQWYPIPASLTSGKGCYVTVGGTFKATVFYN